MRVPSPQTLRAFRGLLRCQSPGWHRVCCSFVLLLLWARLGASRRLPAPLHAMRARNPSLHAGGAHSSEREDGEAKESRKGETMHHAQVHELLYQALETELGGIQVYQTALQCTVNAALHHEWQEYLAQTETHAQILRELCATLKLNPDQDTPGRQVVRHLGQALVTAMERALAAGNPEAAQLVAAECVVDGRNERSFELGTAQ